MDKETIIKTVQSLRDYINRVNLEGPQYSQAWDEMQAADHLIEQLKRNEVLTLGDALVGASSAAEPYLNNLASLRGALQTIMQRNRGLEAGLHHLSFDICLNFTKDFMTLYNSYLKDVIFPGGQDDATV